MSRLIVASTGAECLDCYHPSTKTNLSVDVLKNWRVFKWTKDANCWFLLPRRWNLWYTKSNIFSTITYSRLFESKCDNPYSPKFGQLHSLAVVAQWELLGHNSSVHYWLTFECVIHIICDRSQTAFDYFWGRCLKCSAAWVEWGNSFCVVQKTGQDYAWAITYQLGLPPSPIRPVWKTIYIQYRKEVEIK